MAGIWTVPSAPYAYEQITVAGAAAGLTTSKYGPPSGAKAISALITSETAQIRYTLDGSTTPTSDIGHLMSPGDALILDDSTAVKNFKFILVSGSPVLNVTYFRR